LFGAGCLAADAASDAGRAPGAVTEDVLAPILTRALAAPKDIASAFFDGVKAG